MSQQYLNRYQYFTISDNMKIVPGVEIPIKTTDKYYQYKLNKDRLDRLSESYYSSPTFGWLIMLANPTFGGLESNIPDNALIRIPHPLVESLQDYKRMIEEYNFYYGE